MLIKLIDDTAVFYSYIIKFNEEKERKIYKNSTTKFSQALDSNEN